jgi:hypothetical protein
MKLMLILFVTLLMSCGKPIVDCKCNDDFVFENTFDTSLCNQPIKETIKYTYSIMRCPLPKGNILIIDSIFETHKGFKRYIVH